jgi:PTS system nitrogen regulatory IIA component
MSLEKIIKPDGVLCNATARSKKHCLEILSELLIRSNPEIASERIGISASNAALIKLSEPVDFDSADGEPVDLVFGMMVPTELADGHRADIKLVTRVLADEGLRARLRSMNSSSGLYNALIDGSSLAAPETQQS